MNFKLQRQITVAIENEPGRLAAISKALEARGINIKDLSILDNVEQGVIACNRLVEISFDDVYKGPPD